MSIPPCVPRSKVPETALGGGLQRVHNRAKELVTSPLAMIGEPLMPEVVLTSDRHEIGISQNDKSIVVTHITPARNDQNKPIDRIETTYTYTMTGTENPKKLWWRAIVGLIGSIGLSLAVAYVMMHFGKHPALVAKLWSVGAVAGVMMGGMLTAYWLHSVNKHNQLRTLNVTMNFSARREALEIREERVQMDHATLLAGYKEVAEKWAASKKTSEGNALRSHRIAVTTDGYKVHFQRFANRIQITVITPNEAPNQIFSYKKGEPPKSCSVPKKEKT